MEKDKNTKDQDRICSYIVDAYEVCVPSESDLETFVISEVVNLGDLDETVYGFTSQKKHMEWLEKRGEHDEFLVEEATTARARKIAEELGEEKCREITKEFLAREKTIFVDRLRFHGYDPDAIRNPEKMKEIIRDADPLKGPIVTSAFFFQHAYYAGDWAPAPLPSWIPSFWEGLDRQMSSLQFNWGKVRLYDGYFWTNPSILFRPRRGWRRYRYRSIPRLGPYGWNDRVASAAHYP